MRWLFALFLIASVPDVPEPRYTFKAFGHGRARAHLIIVNSDREEEAIVDLPWSSGEMPADPGEHFRFGVAHTDPLDTSEITCEIWRGDLMVVASIWTCDYEVPRRRSHR